MLKQMRERGEIDEEQYEALRRHVLWGTPLPEHLQAGLPPGLKRTERPGPPSEPEQPVPPQHFAPRTGPANPPAGHTATPYRPGARQPQRRAGPPPARPQGPPPRQPPGPPQGRPPGPSSGRPTGPPVGLPPTRPTPPAPPAPPPKRGYTKVIIAGVAAFVVIVVGAAAGWWYLLRDDGGVTPAHYAAAICPDLAGWHSDISSAADGLSGQLSGTDDRSQQKKIAARYYTDAAARTDALLPKLQAVTAPDGPADEHYADRLTQAVRSASGRFHNLAAQVNELEPAGKSSFTAALTILTSHPDAPLDQVTGLLAAGRPPGDIDDALASESTCQDLR